MLLVLLSREPLRTSHVLLACYTKAMHLAGAVEHAGVCGLCFTHAAHAGWLTHSGASIFLQAIVTWDWSGKIQPTWRLLRKCLKSEPGYASRLPPVARVARAGSAQACRSLGTRGFNAGLQCRQLRCCKVELQQARPASSWHAAPCPLPHAATHRTAMLTCKYHAGRSQQSPISSSRTPKPTWTPSGCTAPAPACSDSGARRSNAGMAAEAER